MRTYLLSAVASAFLVSLLSAFPQRKSIRRIVTLCGGIFLLLTLVRPLLQLRFGDLEDYFSQFQPEEAVIDGAVAEGEKESARLITERTREYILDKAGTLGAAISVEVTLRTLTGAYQYPYSVTITGDWTEEQRRALTEYMAGTLGIPEERQLWNKEN